LTHGQVASALARGQPPSAQLIDQLRYLRQLGVPFSKAELGGGSGNRLRYGFDHLIELGVAVFGLERGMRPRDIARILVDHRVELRRCYRDTLATLPRSAAALETKAFRIIRARGSQVRSGLAAGGRWIRTSSTAVTRARDFGSNTVAIESPAEPMIRGLSIRWSKRDSNLPSPRSKDPQ
jgi:hypothetical protein